MFYALLCSLGTLLVHISTQEGMVLDKINFLTARWPEIIRAPLFACFPCMCSVWGTIFWITANTSGFMHQPVISTQMIYFVFCTGGINTIISILILSRINDELF